MRKITASQAARLTTAASSWLASSWLRPISASEGRACPLAGRDDLQRPAARPAGQADKGHRKIAFLALATCSNVTRALTAAVHAALGKGDKGTAWSTRFAPRTAGCWPSRSPVIPLAVRSLCTRARQAPGIFMARSYEMRLPVACGSSATTGRVTAGPRPSRGAQSPTAPAMSARSALSLASIGWRRGACQAAVRTCSGALPCSRA